MSAAARVKTSFAVCYSIRLMLCHHDAPVRLRGYDTIIQDLLRVHLSALVRASMCCCGYCSDRIAGFFRYGLLAHGASRMSVDSSTGDDY